MLLFSYATFQLQEIHVWGFSKQTKKLHTFKFIFTSLLAPIIQKHLILMPFFCFSYNKFIETLRTCTINCCFSCLSSVSFIFSAGLCQRSLISVIFVHLRTKTGVQHLQVWRDGAGKCLTPSTLWWCQSRSESETLSFHVKSHICK